MATCNSFIRSGAVVRVAILAALALGNLFWVTLGNLLGGAGGVALAYRYAYLGAKGGTR